MLDSFEILTTSGVVLWSRSYASVGANVINSLIKDVFIEQHGGAAAESEDGVTSGKPSFRKDQYTLKWTTARDLGLIFVVRLSRWSCPDELLTRKRQAVYQSLIHLSWIDKLLDNVKTLFVNLYGGQLKKQNSSVVECPFDDYFEQQVRELENSGGPAVPKDTPRVTVTEAPLPPQYAQERGQEQERTKGGG